MFIWNSFNIENWEVSFFAILNKRLPIEESSARTTIFLQFKVILVTQLAQNVFQEEELEIIFLNQNLILKVVKP